MDYVLRGEGRHRTFNALANITDRFGHRMTGSESLKQAIGTASHSHVIILVDAATPTPMYMISTLYLGHNVHIKTFVQFAYSLWTLGEVLRLCSLFV